MGCRFVGRVCIGPGADRYGRADLAGANVVWPLPPYVVPRIEKSAGFCWIEAVGPHTTPIRGSKTAGKLDCSRVRFRAQILTWEKSLQSDVVVQRRRGLRVVERLILPRAASDGEDHLEGDVRSVGQPGRIG